MPEISDDWFQKRTDEELRDIRKLLGEVVPRRELELRWDVETESRKRMQKQLDEVRDMVSELGDEVREGHKELAKSIEAQKELINDHEITRLQGQLPKWFLPVFVAVVPVVTAVVVHFVR